MEMTEPFRCPLEGFRKNYKRRKFGGINFRAAIVMLLWAVIGLWRVVVWVWG